MRNATLLGLILTFLSLPVLAYDAQGEIKQVQVAGLGRMDYQHLFTAISEPGESMEALVLRIAPELREFSDATGFEACGHLASDGERFGIVVGTNLANAGCVSATELVPNGMKALPETIHSHRQAGNYRVNRNDQAMTGARAGQRFTAKDADEFSATDFNAHGYLVGARQVWHQEGKRSVRQVARLP